MQQEEDYMVHESGRYRGIFKDIILPGNFLERHNDNNSNVT
jgi:hypothetical protein